MLKVILVKARETFAAVDRAELGAIFLKSVVSPVVRISPVTRNPLLKEAESEVVCYQAKKNDGCLPI